MHMLTFRCPGWKHMCSIASATETLTTIQTSRTSRTPQNAVFPDEGEGGLLEVLGSFTDAVAELQPDKEKYDGLLVAVQELDTCKSS